MNLDDFIFQDDLVFVAHFPFEEGKSTYGHVIVELRRHITSPGEMTSDEAMRVGLWQQKISHYFEMVAGFEHTYIFRIGDVTPHLHFHLVPRAKNTPREIWGVYMYQDPRVRKASRDEIKSFSRQCVNIF